MTLLEKFDSVNVSIDAELLPIDLAFCIKEEQMFKESQKRILESLETFTKLLETEHTKSVYEMPDSTNYRSSIYRNHQYKPENIDYLAIEYSSAYSVLFLRKSRDSIVKVFVINVIDHFSKKYNLQINLQYIDKFDYNKHDTYRKVLILLKSYLGHLDFELMAIMKLKKEFLSIIKSKKSYEIKNKTFTIINMYWQGYNANQYIKQVTDAFDLFEHNTITGMCDLPTVSEGIDYPLNISKVESIRFYKNGKVAVKFASVQDINDFMIYYNLDKLDN